MGGSVTSHQDGTFLYTRPRQTVVGLWLALDDAHEGNGCLWARPGSHREPLRRRFVRDVGADGEVVMAFSPVDALHSKQQLTEATLAPRLLGEGLSNGLKGVAAAAKGALGLGRKDLQQRVNRSEDAREWEGYYPPADLVPVGGSSGGEPEGGGGGGGVDLSPLAAKGFVALPVKAGDLVMFPGTLDHLSFPNGSPHARHTFQLHMVEGPTAGVEWANENWLQYPGGAPFPNL